MHRGTGHLGNVKRDPEWVARNGAARSWNQENHRTWVTIVDSGKGSWGVAAYSLAVPLVGLPSAVAAPPNTIEGLLTAHRCRLATRYPEHNGSGLGC